MSGIKIPYYHFKNHFNGCTTVILGEYISNGCTMFHISEIDIVCVEHDVPDEMKLEVLNKYNAIVNNVNSKHLYTLDYFIKNYNEIDSSSLYMLARQGHCQDLVLTKCPYLYYRLYLVLINNNYELEKLAVCENLMVRKSLAIRGKMLDILVNDPDEGIASFARGVINANNGKIQGET